MIRKLLIPMAVAALATFSLAACGGDDEEPVPPETVEQPAEEPGDGAGAGAGGQGGTLEVEADPAGDLSYTTGALTVGAGDVEIAFDNPATLPHDVRIESEDGEELGGTEVITDSSTTATVTLEPGDYTYFCSVAGHREGGMEEDLTVE